MTEAGTLSLVGIHATVISIFVAVGFGYYSYIARKRKELLFQVFDEADKVNQISPPRYTLWVNNEVDYDELIKKLQLIIIALTNPSYLREIVNESGEKKVLNILREIVNESGEKKVLEEQFSDIDVGEVEHFEIFVILSDLVTHYPFRGEDGEIEFNSIKDVEEWINKSSDVCDKLDSIIGRNMNNLEQILPSKTKAKITTVSMIHEFVKVLEKLSTLTKSVKRRKRRWKIFKEKSSHPILIVVSIVLVWLSFTTGVIAPLVSSGFFHWIFIGVPLGTYGLALLGITCSVGKGVYKDIRSPPYSPLVDRLLQMTKHLSDTKNTFRKD